MPVSAVEMFDRMAYDFMARFNWTIEEVDGLPFPLAMSIREGMVDEQRRADKQSKDLALKAKTGMK